MDTSLQLKKILLVGSGNVANHLAEKLSKLNYTLGIYSRNKPTGKALAKKINCDFHDQLSVAENFDLLLVCVNDEQINALIEQAPPQVPLAYTSGGTSLVNFKRKNLGVLYPLQTFTKDRALDLKKVPFFIESNSASLEKELMLLGGQLGSKAHLVTSEVRAHLHLCGVLVNNFTNHMYVLAEEHLAAHNIPFEHLKPLIKETASKVMDLPPKKAQTGPALRGDLSTIKRHQELMDESLKEIYSFISNSIKQMNHGK